VAEQVRAADPAVRNEVVPGLHPTRSARCLVGGSIVGQVGEVDPQVLEAHGITERVGWLELDLDLLLGSGRRSDAYRPVSRFPSSDVDLAFSVPDDVSAIDVERTLAGADPLIWSVELFDVYRSDDVATPTRSLAYRLRIEAPDRTLTDAEVASVRSAAIAAVESAHGATLRT
jgi:phenylalanyl-tRNA synthetase beta chain